MKVISYNDLKNKWDINLNKAKEILQKKQFNQMEVAQLALEVCEINWGGYKHGNEFTISKFASQLGINPKTLSMWINIKKNVYDKVDIKTAETLSYSEMISVGKNVNNKTSKEEVKRQAKYVKEKFIDKKILKYIRGIKSIIYNLSKIDVYKECSKEVKEELMFYLNILLNTNKLKEVNGVNHGLVSIWNDAGPFLSANEALGRVGESIKIKNELGKIIYLNRNDRIAYDIIKEKKKITPTVLGNKMFSGSKNAKKLKALRLLQKYESCSLVKNINGEYYLNET